MISTKNWRKGAATFLGLLAISACGGSGTTDEDVWVTRGEGSSKATTRLFQTEAPRSAPSRGEPLGVAQEELVTANGVSVFFPPPGGSTLGFCFIGLFTDSAGNFYPVNPQLVFKLLPNGTLVNGDANPFLNSPFASYASLDEPAQTVYAAFDVLLRSAPFVEGATFSPLRSFDNSVENTTLGRGPLAGSLFINEALPTGGMRILRVTLSPPSVTVFATGFAGLFTPISMGADGVSYVADFPPSGPVLVRISPTGQTSPVAFGTTAQLNRAVGVDAAGNVYWSQANGVNVYSPSGALQSVLPGPPDKAEFGGPTAMAFDAQGDLFLVENVDCKKMYKYDLTCAPAAPPVFTFVPADITTTSCGPITSGTATASDDCGPVTVTSNAPASFPPGATIVTFTATGSTGLTATATQIVTRVLTDNVACCPAGTNVIVGTSNNNTLNGTAGSDCIFGLGGQDTINGLGGNDFISGGDGNDLVSGGTGNDVEFGGSGQDNLSGNAGTDFLDGGEGDDQCFGGDGNDFITGSNGQDRLFGENNNDRLIGGAGDDRLEGGAGDDLLDGSGLHDVCIGGPGTDTFLICESQTQ